MEKWDEHKWDLLQHVDVSKEEVLCQKCEADILDMANFTYAEKYVAKPTYWEELCKCKVCGTLFVMHYDIFDPEGHVYPRVFTEDINNPDYKWQDTLTDEQKRNLSEHLEACHICKERLSAEMLSDAWLGSFMENLRKELRSK